jgi:hypothetical protein
LGGYERDFFYAPNLQDISNLYTLYDECFFDITSFSGGSETPSELTYGSEVVEPPVVG